MIWLNWKFNKLSFHDVLIYLAPSKLANTFHLSLTDSLFVCLESQGSPFEFVSNGFKANGGSFE